MTGWLGWMFDTGTGKHQHTAPGVLRAGGSIGRKCCSSGVNRSTGRRERRRLTEESLIYPRKAQSSRRRTRGTRCILYRSEFYSNIAVKAAESVCLKQHAVKHAGSMTADLKVKGQCSNQWKQLFRRVKVHHCFYVEANR